MNTKLKAVIENIAALVETIPPEQKRGFTRLAVALYVPWLCYHGWYALTWQRFAGIAMIANDYALAEVNFQWRNEALVWMIAPLLAVAAAALVRWVYRGFSSEPTTRRS